MSNYPDSVSPGDPRAPWNQPDAEEGEYLVKLTVVVRSTSDDDAANYLFNLLDSNRKIWHVEIDRVTSND